MTSGTAPGGYSNLWKRAITGIVLVAVALGTLFAGQWPFWLLVEFLAIAMMFEWSRLMQASMWKMLFAICLMTSVTGALMPFPFTSFPIAIVALLFGTAFCSAITVSLRLGFGFFYIGLASLAIIFLREQGGLILTLWMLATVWATDIGAYFSGKTIGGPKLAPKFSPNKTWAGLVGGIICAALVSLIFAFQTTLPLLIVPLAALFAIVAQMGDLFESWLKRRANVKDSSNLFPGHGGALDRLDGLLPVAIGAAALNWAGLL
ncbi:phosphatidate cytidylyltransferase [Parasphingopyxis lamellibrachiae]|uniref:Phosphatidate cytidylyltransferase n=1 Tax=Parasphingopyxis lamellibrachiae TaxID=680125 RepID=A0A3D9FD60_9SPHN|nr:phosphatidate cytidylyltransferase [Parasphingopyxis lamellibrachiae]RED15598.1 phosphatidate cytidylyltransferase [Parasphingopyxis lamellibrachiae]